MSGELGAIQNVRVSVRDLARSRAFFRDAVGLAEVFASEHIVQFETGAADLVIEPAGDEPDEVARLGLYTGIMFAVADAAATQALLTGRGVEFLGPPEKMFWGATFAHFRDPDGNVFTACQYPA